MTVTVAAPLTESRQKLGFSHESAHNESIEWYTPPEIFKALGLVFDLDPCSPGAGLSHVPARKHYTIDDDGLTSSWFSDQGAMVFMNPPYGKHTPDWMARLAEHARDGGQGIALVFARTDVKWFQEHCTGADLICFVSSRIRFYKGNTTDQAGSPGAGSMLVAYGPDAARAVLDSGLGACMTFKQPVG
mgnify:CR=1 FL=1